MEEINISNVPTSDSSSEASSGGPKKTNHKLVIYLLVSALILLLSTSSLLAVNYLNARKASEQNITPTPTQTNEASLEPTHTPQTTENTPTPLPTITVAVAKQPALFQLGFYAVDYSSGKSGGQIPDVTVKLFNSTGTLIDQKKVAPIVKQGNGSSGGNAIFSVPFGTYKAGVETDKLVGDYQVTIKSSNDQPFYPIYLYTKPIIVSGYYYFDENKNFKRDINEKIFPQKKISVYVNTVNGDRYIIGETGTNNEGFYTITSKYAGLYSSDGEYIEGYSPYPGVNNTNASGGESISIDVVAWPNSH